ncbi:MAG: hypothetical protein KGJ86_13350 [Chloroflexota bacterium]|nr:hypothetical protein [Chloroflexota bacterium]
MPNDFLPTESELAMWKRRAADTAERMGWLAIAGGMRYGGIEGAVRALAGLSVPAAERYISSALALLPSNPSLDSTFAQLTHLGLDRGGGMPGIAEGPETLAFHDRLDELRNTCRSRSVDLGRKRQVRLVEYVSTVGVTTRLNDLGVGPTAFSMSGHLFKNLIDTLVCTPMFWSLGETPPDDLLEAYQLARHGFTPVEQRAGGWVVRMIFS